MNAAWIFLIVLCLPFVVLFISTRHQRRRMKARRVELDRLERAMARLERPEPTVAFRPRSD